MNARIERSRRYLLLLLLMSAVALAPARSQVPEPQAYWLGPIHGPVPATITGGSVVGTAQLAHLLARGGVVLIDVAEAPHHPSGLPPGTLWLPPHIATSRAAHGFRMWGAVRFRRSLPIGIRHASQN